MFRILFVLTLMFVSHAALMAEMEFEYRKNSVLMAISGIFGLLRIPTRLPIGIGLTEILFTSRDFLVAILKKLI